jgi:hypothetical protein
MMEKHTPEISDYDERFYYCIKHSNPELWRTSVPRIVRHLCRGQRGEKGLVLTWMAIHYLIVLWSAEGRSDFGVRDIAEEAGVGRNQLTGPDGYIQQLVTLGLLHIVGSRRIPGLKEPRPVYAIDLLDLERRSMRLVPDILNSKGVRPPPRPARSPEQLALFDASASTEQDSQPHQPAPALHPREAATHANGTATHANGTEQPWGVPATNVSGTAATETVTAMHQEEPDGVQTVTGAHYEEPGMHAGMPETHQNAPGIAPDRDIEGGIERAREKKEREKAPTREKISEAQQQQPADTAQSIQAIAAETARAVVLEVLKGINLPHPNDTSTPEAPDIPPTPQDEPPLPASPLDLWRADREHISQRDTYQLEMLARSYDSATGGYGAYWLGRAVMMADYCLAPKGQPVTVQYVRGILKRWSRPDVAWGSDLDVTDTEHEWASSAPPQAPASASSTPASVRLSPEQQAHPAIQTFFAVTGQHAGTLDHELAELITTTVPADDQTTWRTVLTDWKANGWNRANVRGMLDRYRRASGQEDPDRVSAAPIHNAGLDPVQYGHWLGMFREARDKGGPSAARRVLEQFSAWMQQRSEEARP